MLRAASLISTTAQLNIKQLSLHYIEPDSISVKLKLAINAHLDFIHPGHVRDSTPGRHNPTLPTSSIFRPPATAFVSAGPDVRGDLEEQPRVLPVIFLLMRGHSRGRKCPQTAAHSWLCVLV